jgi:hypothetical protein
LKTKVLKNGNIKVWWDKEEKCNIVSKNDPLYDTLIDVNLNVKKYSRILVKEIKDAGLDKIHGKLIECDNSLEDRLDKLPRDELDTILMNFNSTFNTNYGYHINDNGLVSIVFGKFDTYEDFKRNYFGTFLLEMFAFKVNILLSEEKDETIKGLSGFISRFADDYLKTYLEASRTLKFDNIIREKN